MKKRIISLAVILMLILSCIGITSFAESAETIFMDVSESSDRFCNATGDANEPIYSSANGKYISFNSGDWQAFDFTVPVSGTYVINVYAGLSSEGPVSALSLYDFDEGTYNEVTRKIIVPSGSYSEFTPTCMGEFELKAGLNRIKLSETYSDIHLNGIEIAPKMAAPVSLDVSMASSSYNSASGEAEDIRSNSNGKYSVFSENDYYLFDITMPYGGTFDLTVYAGLRVAGAETEVYIFDEATQSYELALTNPITVNGSLTRFGATDMGALDLKRGLNKIKILQKESEIRISSIEISEVKASDEIKMDVRLASDSYNNGTGTKEGLAVCDNGFFVSFNSGDWQDFNLNLSKAGTYSVTVLAGLAGEAKTSVLLYNKKTGAYNKVAEKNIEPSGSLSVFGETEMVEIDLPEGNSKIRLKQTYSDIHLHGIVVKYLEEPVPVEMTVNDSTEGVTSQGQKESTYLDANGKPYISFNAGDYQVFDFNLTRSGRYKISLLAGLTSSGPISEIAIYNQADASYETLGRNLINVSESLLSYDETSMGEYNLKAGDVKLKVSQIYSDIHLSAIKVEYVGAAKTEIEVAALETVLTTATEEDNFLLFDSPQRADYTVTVPESGNYEITAIVTECYYRIPQISIWENNVELASARIPNLITNNICVPLSLGKVNLTEGEHNFRVRHSGVTASNFYLEKLIFTKADALVEVTVANETYLSGDMVSRTEKAEVTDETIVLEANGILTYDATVLDEGWYLCEPEFAGENKDIVITANEKVLSNGKGTFMIYLKEGDCTLTASAHEACELNGIYLKYLPDVTEEIMSSLVKDINGAENVKEMAEALEEYAPVFDLDMEALTDGIFFKDAVYAGMIDRSFKSADEIISELKNLSITEKTNPCVSIYNGEKRTDALESGNISVKISSDKMRENLSVLVALYNGGRLIKVEKGDYTGTENTITVPLGELTISGTETLKIISVDNLSDISPVNIRSNIVAEIFVSPTGNDSADGINSPVKTIKKAQEIVAELTQNMTGDIIVNLAKGTYYEGETLIFDEAQGGKNGYNVIWKGDNALLSGGTAVSGWTEYKNGIYSAELGGVSDVRNLYVNGYPAIKAKTESAFVIEETYKSDMATLDFDGVVAKDEYFPSNITDAETIELVLDTSWITQRFPVTDVVYDGENSIVLLDESVLRHNTPVEGTAISANKMFYLENSLAFLDKPGEFYYDKDADMLYYYPLESENIFEDEIIAGTVEGLVSVEGTALGKVSNIVFSGITFKYGTWNMVSDYGYVGTQSDVYTNTQTGESDMIFPQFNIEWAENIRIEDCVFDCIGSTAVRVGDGSDSVLVKGNLFKDIAASGIQIGNFAHSENNMEELTRNVTAENNAFVRCGFEYRGCSAISTYYVNNVNISHNDIKDLPYSGMTAGWGWGGSDPEGWGNITISNNKYDTVMQNLDDGGGVYLLGHMRNSKITGNYFNKVGRISSSMYADSGTGYAEFSGNVSLNSRQWLTIASIGLHDVRVRGNYSDTSRGLITSDEYVNEGNVNNISADNLPEDAALIMENAGLSDEYKHLAEGNELPDGRESMIFISPKISYYNGYKFEAEDCKTYTSGIVYASSYLGVNQNSYAKFDVTVPNGGKYKIRAFIATPGSSSKIGFLQGTTLIAQAQVPNTGAYGNFRMIDVGEVTLPGGVSELTMKSLSSAFHLDCFILEPIE